MTLESSERARGSSGAGPRVASWLAGVLFGLSVCVFLAGVALHVSTLRVQPPSSWGTGGLSALLYVYLPFLAFPVVGYLIASNRPRNPIGWICLAAGLLLMLGPASGSYAVYGLRAAGPGSVPYPATVGYLGEWTGPAGLGLLCTFLLLLFPDGRVPSRRWLPVAWLSATVLFLTPILTTLSPGTLSDMRNVSNPFGMEQYPWVASVNAAVGLLLPVCMLASAASLVVRYGRSPAETREQIKWLAFAASVVALGVSAAVVGGTFFAADDTADAGPLLARLLQDAVTLSFAGVPVAIGFAVLKYRLYDIDVVINRALVYLSLTATLAGVYFGGVIALQRLFVVLTGEKSTLAVVASTLLIAALFNPLRTRVQAFVDRRFYRKRYDARKTLEVLSAKLRDETDLEALHEDLVGVVRETMRPEHVGLWLQPTSPAKSKPY